MFIPCDENDKPLEMPERSSDWNFGIIKDFSEELINKWQKYQQAKERVLFAFAKIHIQHKDKDNIKGSSYISIKPTSLNWFIVFRDDNTIKFIDKQLSSIEDVVFMSLKLTESAVKQIYN